MFFLYSLFMLPYRPIVLTILVDSCLTLAGTEGSLALKTAADEEEYLLVNEVKIEDETLVLVASRSIGLLLLLTNNPFLDGMNEFLS